MNRRKESNAGKQEKSTDVKDGADLSALTVNELYRLCRCWPERHQRRVAEGREHVTFYFEGRIVRELKRRKASTDSEQLKIDYCKMTYRNELENLSFIYSLPINTQN